MTLLLNFCFQGSDGGVREAVLAALKGVLRHAGKNLSSAVRNRVYGVLKDFIRHDDDQVRICAASILGILTKVCQLVKEFLFLPLFGL